MDSVTILIVNYKAADLILRNLPNLTAQKQGVGRLDIVIVDNASPERGAEDLERGIEAQGAGDRVTLIASERNGGFAAGNNTGLREIYARQEQPDAVMLLNPDTELFEGTIAKLIDAAAMLPEAGGFGGGAVDEDGRPKGCAYRFPGIGIEAAQFPLLARVMRPEFRDIAVKAPSDAPVPCDWVSGSCFLLRREALEDVPFFDEGYFLYFEETDFCRRMKGAGWPIYHVPQAAYVHIGGASTGINKGKSREGRMPRYWYDSWRRYFTKNHGRTYTAAAGVVKLLVLIAWRLRGWQRRGGVNPGDFVQFCLLPTISGKPL